MQTHDNDNTNAGPMGNSITIQTLDNDDDNPGPKGNGITIRHLDMNSSGNLLIPTSVNGVETFAVIDTAAQASLISLSLAKKMKPPLKYEAKFTLKGPNIGSDIPAKFCKNLEIAIGEHVYIWDVFVADIHDDFILGLDFMANFGLDICLTERYLTIGTEKIPARLDFPADACRIARIHAHRDFSIPPHTGRTILLDCVAMDDGKVKIFEPTDIPSLALTNTCFIANGTVPFTILNFGESKVQIYKGDFLGVVTDSHDPDILLTPAPNSTDCENKPQLSDIIVRRVATQDKDSHPALLSPEFARLTKELPTHITDLFERSSAQLTLHQAAKLAALLGEYADIFSKHDMDLGCFSAVKHRIQTPNATPHRQNYRPTPVHFQAEEEAHLQKLLDAGIIKESDSDWASPVCLVRKKCGGVRYCVDMRFLNTKTIKDAFPLPRISDCLDALSGSEFFSTLDLACGYYQIEIHPDDRHKTAFITKFGLFEHIRMGFGLCNGPATFQRAMQFVLKGLLWHEALAYLDDVISLGRSFDDGLKNLMEIFHRFRTYNLKLKPGKCALFQKQVLFLGHMVTPEGIAINPDHVATVKKWPLPQTRRTMESFLGFVNYHRNHIKDFAKLCDPLHKAAASVTKGHIDLDDSHAEAFEKLRETLTKAPVLVYPDLDHTFILDCDASDFAIGCELSQSVDGVERVVAYGSYTMTPAQRRYCTTRKELLAVVRFTRQFRHYLLGKPFICRTDHNSLTWLMSFKTINGQLARWLEELQEYDMHVIHRPGKAHVNADALSRLGNGGICPNYTDRVPLEALPCFVDGPCHHCTRVSSKWKQFEDDIDYVVPLAVRQVSVDATDTRHDDIDYVVPLAVRQVSVDATDTRLKNDDMPWYLGYTEEQLQDAQQTDPDLRHIMSWVKSGTSPNEQELALCSATVKHYWTQREQLTLKGGVLFYRWDDPLHPGLLLVVPHSLKEEVLFYCHDNKDSGHIGPYKTFLRAKQSFYWKHMRAECERYVRTCAACSKNKKSNRKRRANLQRFHAGCPMERVHIDILGPMTKTTQGNTVILMVIDQFTKWVECFPLPDQCAERVAKTMLDEFFTRMGYPLEIHSDQGRNFTSHIFETLCKLLDITKTRTTSYHPQSNGQVERYNRQVLQMIRCLADRGIKDWDACLPQIAGAMRATINRQTGFTANKLMLGREVYKPADLVFGVAAANRVDQTECEYVANVEEVMRQVHTVARDSLQRAQSYQKRHYDRKARQRTYELADLVYLLDAQTDRKLSRKLQPPYSGPCLVTQVISPVLFKIRGRKKEMVVHHDRLEPCDDRHIPLWMKRMRNEFLQGENDAGRLEDPTLDARDSESSESEGQLTDLDDSDTDPDSNYESTENISQLFEETPSKQSEVRRSSRGRQLKPNLRLRDFVTSFPDN
jgi:transposase InsO family protein